MLVHDDVNLDVSDVKRLRIDFPQRFKCPQCGKSIGVDAHFYLSYVVKDTKDTIALYCERCSEYYSLPIKIESIRLTISYDTENIQEG